MNKLKKNQIVIFVIALMLVAAGYMNYTSNIDKGILSTSSNIDKIGSRNDYTDGDSIGDARLVSSSNVENSNIIQNEKDIEMIGENRKEEKIEEKEVIVDETDSYFDSSRLERDTMYSQMIESYQKILESTTISEEQKSVAQTEIKNINNIKNSIMICENLIKTKGIEDLIIFINDLSINVVVKNKNLNEEQIAQIQNIITREFKTELENIHISSK